MNVPLLFLGLRAGGVYICMHYPALDLLEMSGFLGFM